MPTCGLYYKHVTIVNDDSSVVSKRSLKLIDDPSVVIYDQYRFIIQATEWATFQVPTLGKLLALPINISLGLPGTNTLAYCKDS